MNYIVFDLEWNQSPGGKKYSNSRLPFEIIEIGAVKMNEQRGQDISKAALHGWRHEATHGAGHALKARLQATCLDGTFAHATPGNNNLVASIHCERIVLRIVEVLQVRSSIVTHRRQFLYLHEPPHIQHLV